MNAELISVCDRLISALLNGFYQGLALTVFVWCCLKFLPATNASTRHAVWLATLILVAILPAANFRPRPELPLFSSVGDSKVERAISKPEREVVLSGTLGFLPESTKIETQDFSSDRETDATEAGPGTIQISDDSAGLKEEGEETASVASGPSNSVGLALGRIISKFSAEWPISAPNGASVILIAFWLATAAVFLLRLLWQFWVLRTLKKQSGAVSEEIRELFVRICVEQKMRRAARLILSPGIETPMAAGFWKPLVLLPEKILQQAPLTQIQHVLRHEIAHIGRRDDWANLAQQFIKAIFFFNPMVWWLSRRLSVEREIACDDHVLALGHSPRSYALFLTEFAGRSKCRELAAAPAAWSNKSQLKERIGMLLDTKRNASPRLAATRAGFLGIAAVLMSLLALCAGPRVVLANESPAEQAEVSKDIPVVAPAGTSSEAAISPAAPVPHPKISAAPRAAVEVAPAIASTPAPPAAGVAVAKGPAWASVPLGFPGGAIMATASPDGENPPEKPRAKRRKPAGDDSIEQRLARLEAMVDKLVAENKAKRKTKEGYGDFKFDFKGPYFDEQQMQKLQDELKAAKLSDEDIAKIKEETHRAAEIAKRETEKAMRDMERARRDGDRARVDAQQMQNDFGQGPDGLKAQHQALEQQRRALEKQMRSLERQMQKLEKQQQELEQQTEHRENAEHEEHADEDGPKHKEKK